MSHHEQESLSRENRRHERKHIPASKIWLIIGVIVLCALLLFWIFDIGTFIGPNQ